MTRDRLNSENVLTITKYIISLQDQRLFVKFNEGHTVELVRTKLEPPLNRNHLIERPRLQTKLDEAATVSLTLILAPAGYGKSSLLSQWFAALKSSSRQVGWLSLQVSDRDSIGLLCYVAAALSAGGSRFEPPLDQVFASEAYTAPEPLITA